MRVFKEQIGKIFSVDPPLKPHPNAGAPTQAELLFDRIHEMTGFHLSIGPMDRRRPKRWWHGWVSHRLRSESAGTRTSWPVSLWGPALLMVVAVLLAGCPKKPGGTHTGKPGVQTRGPGAVSPGAGPGREGKVEEEKILRPPPIREVPVRLGPEKRPEPGPGPAAKDSPLKDVFFDFGEAVLREDAKQTLNDNIRWLKANPQVHIMVEGHCDERGTNEYNLALGERRARVVRDFLVAGGIDATRISTVSYGEERPFVLGHDEVAWKWNRRAHFVVRR